MDVASRVRSVIADAVEAEGVELLHVAFNAREHSAILRVYIDKENGVDISDCSRVSRRISALLDIEDVIEGHYVFEVSSPGIERPLFSEADYVRFRGKEIRLVTKEKIEGRKKFTGRIDDFEDGVLTLACDDREYSIPFTSIQKSNLVYRFE